ncbi:MAG: toll/interleukin-1 receptor domain-containing protein [Gammaproteobacteria bacterium]|nr:toll/interleukin-1 receptor domain-containing protein [Gammaproteobacteria bacterium]MBU1723270.1 toll/interleukin-1 receptor domain-containing protein [Gammaproteobacteria bacterium]MBU2006565.1 toll/interleukin-1 receptor domain-containing protein [Gammaproteobacteria bacterium]
MPESIAPVRYLFLSHNSTDKPGVERFAETLENRPLAKAHKLKVWLDKNNLQHGVQYTNQFAANINHPDTCAFVLFMPREAIRAYVQYEINIALDRHLNDQNAGKRFPILPIYPGARTGRVELPENIRTFNYREFVDDDLQKIDAIIADALGLNLPVGASPAGDISAGHEESPAGQAPTRKQQDGYDRWLSFVLTRQGENIQAEDDNGNISTLPLAELPEMDSPAAKLTPLTRLLLDRDWHSLQLDGQKLRLRIMTDDPQLAMLPWQRLPHPQTGQSLLDCGCMVETGPVQGRSYRSGFTDIAPHTPLLVIPSHHQHEIAGDKHYGLVQSYLDAYLDIHGLIPRVTNPQALQRELRLHQPDLLYIYARFDGQRLQLDSGIDGEDSVSLQTLGAWISAADIHPVIVINLIGGTLEHYPQALVKPARLVWIQATSRIRKLNDLERNLAQVLEHSARNPDLSSLIMQQAAHCHLGMQNLLWLNGQTPSLNTGSTHKRAQQLRAALLKVMLGRGDLKDRMAGGIYRHLNQRIPLTTYAMTGDAKACPHDVPEQIKQRLQWDDPERSLPVVQFYFHITIEPSDDIEELLDMSISEGILHGSDDMEHILTRELERRGLQQQECCIALNWLFRVGSGLETEVPGWLDTWGKLVCEYFGGIRLERAILVNAVCMEVPHETSAASVQAATNKELRNFRNLPGCAMQPIIHKEPLGKLEADEINDFLETSQRYWYNELKLAQYHIDPWEFAEWVAEQTGGLFEDTVTLIWKQYQRDYQEYLNQ